MTATPNSQYDVETYSGIFVDTRHPDPATINLEDIAHALSHTCRYGGHCKRFYSVAEHAVLVSRRMEELDSSNRRQRAGLHHDDAEAYLGDIPRPMKPLLGSPYKTLTARMDQAIVDSLRLGLSVGSFHAPEVKAADNWALFVEARFLLPSKGINWTDHLKNWQIDEELWEESQQTPSYWRSGLSPQKARDEFLARHAELIN
jgi:hypothetical protein